MSYTIETELEKKIISVTYFENTSFQDRINLLNELIKICKLHEGINILIDVRNAKQIMTLDEQVEYGELLAHKERYFHRNRTAIVSVKNNNPHPFIVLSASSEGYNHICEFHNINEARKWLQGELR